MTDASRDIWHYHMAGKPCGPVSQELLQRYLSSGNLSAEALVWREGMEDWVPAHQVPELTTRPDRSSHTAIRRREGLAPARIHRPRSFLAFGVLGLGAIAILLFSWKDINRATPAFIDLHTLAVNAYPMETSTRTLKDGSTSYSVEFRDPKGLRYQANGLENATWTKLQKALKEGKTVTARYDASAAAPSPDTILMVYQLETAEEILVSYEKLVDAKTFEKRNTPWIMLLIVFGAGLAIFWGIKFVKARRESA
jgi:hypothetical protein